MPSVENTIEVKKLAQFAEKCTAEILVGFLSGRQHYHKDKDGVYRNYDGGTPSNQSEDTAELAKRLSYGDGNFPPRPFLEEGIAENAEKILTELKKQAEKVHDGLKPNWDKVGTMAVGAVQDFVRGDWYRSHVPNSQKTIEYKGSDKPLIDGGDLISAVTFVVDGK